MPRKYDEMEDQKSKGIKLHEEPDVQAVFKEDGSSAGGSVYNFSGFNAPCQIFNFGNSDSEAVATLIKRLEK